MTTKKTTHTAEFKFKVAMEAVKNLKTLDQIASEFGVQTAQVIQWQEELMEQGSNLFERQKKQQGAKELEGQIEVLKMELEWLKKKVG